MADAYIVGAVRTATGKKKGRLSAIHPIDLGAAVVDELVDRTGIPVDAVDDVIFGVVMQIGAQASNLGRNVSMSSKLDLAVPGTTVDRQCGSSLQAIQFGAQAVMSGTQDVIISGGVEAMSTVEMGSNVRDGLANGRGIPKGERLEIQYPGIQFSQFDGAELLAEKYEITRDELDAFALSSHQRAWEATQKGYFEKEIVPLNIKLEDGTADVHKVDEGIRPEASLEGLQGLNVLREGGVITAGSASQISDGAAAILIANEGAVKKHGLQVRAKIHSLAVVGSDPVIMLEGPIPATIKVLEKAGLSIDDIDLYEVNEAFGSVPLAWAKAVGADLSKLNVNGSSLAAGHPFAATGGRIVATLAKLLAQKGSGRGLISICAAGGQGVVAILEK